MVWVWRGAHLVLWCGVHVPAMWRGVHVLSQVQGVHVLYTPITLP